MSTRLNRIPPGPGQESVWDYPRPPRIEDCSRHVKVVFQSEVMEDSRQSKRVLETSHPLQRSARYDLVVTANNTPMSMIAREANVGPGTIYRNFENKEALINELFLELKLRISEPMLAGFSEGRTTEEIFQEIQERISRSR